MNFLRPMLTLVGTLSGILGIPGVFQDIKMFHTWFDGWQWWNFALVVIGGLLVFYGILPILSKLKSPTYAGLSDEHKFHLAKLREENRHEVFKAFLSSDGGKVIVWFAILLIFILCISIILLIVELQ